MAIVSAKPSQAKPASAKPSPAKPTQKAGKKPTNPTCLILIIVALFGCVLPLIGSMFLKPPPSSAPTLPATPAASVTATPLVRFVPIASVSATPLATPVLPVPTDPTAPTATPYPLAEPVANQAPLPAAAAAANLLANLPLGSGAQQIYLVANKTCDNRALLRGTGFANDAQLDVFYTYQDAFQLGANLDRSRLIREAQLINYNANGFSVLLEPLARPEMQGFANIYYVAEMPAYPNQQAGPVGLARVAPRPNGPLIVPLNPPGQAIAFIENELPMPPTGVPDGVWYATYYHNRVLITDTTRSHLYYDLWFPDGLNYAPVNETLNQGDYSARFDRTEIVTVPYDMRMVLTVDDGARVYIDDRLVLDEWHVGPLRSVATTIPMTAGRHVMRLDHFEAGGASTLCFAWRPADNTAAWVGRYYPNDRLEGEPLMIRDDPEIKFDWVSGGPSNLPSSAKFDSINYSVKWERTFDFADGEYEFALKTTGGARVWVDNVPIPGMDHWMNVNPERIVQTCWVKAGHRHVTVDYRNTYNDAHISFTIKKRVPQARPQELRPMTCP